MLAVPAIAGLSSCDAFDQHLDPCPQGVVLRFRYDCNMEFANAFPSQVDCLTLLIYDGEGNYIGSRSETSRALADEHYAMTIDLPEGDYHFVAYGGMECDKSSFEFVNTPAQGSKLQDLKVKLDPSQVGESLHPLFFGDLDVTVRPTDMDYVCDTVPMMKDTNNLRVVLQQLNGEPLSASEFDFKVVDDNTLMGWGESFSSLAGKKMWWSNAVLPAAETDYTPWSRGEVPLGLTGNGKELVAAYAEMSFPRLVTENAPRLIITRHDGGENVVDIPLINYLLALKSDIFATMPSQEFLDRESVWSMIFILDSRYKWIAVDIKVRDWTVRINNTEF